MNKQKFNNLVRHKLIRATFFSTLILGFSAFINGNVFGQKTSKETKHPSFKVEITGRGEPMILIVLPEMSGSI